MPGPNIEPIDTSSHLISADDGKVLDRDYNVVYKATGQDYRQYQDVLGKCMKCWKNDITAHRKPLLPSVQSDPSEQQLTSLTRQGSVSEAALAMQPNCARLLSYIEIMG